MTFDVATVLATIGLVAVAAVAASAAFRSTRIPDVLLLILFGVLAGPLLHVLEPALFHALAPVAGIAAVLVILFDGGLDMQMRELVRGAGPAVAVAILAFALTAAGSAAIAMLLLKLGLAPAVLLGMAFGGAGVAIVIPLIQRMGVSRDAAGLVNLSSAVSDVLLIVGVFSLSSSLSLHEAGIPAFALRFAASFLVAASVGLLGGLAWGRLLRGAWALGHESLATVGAVFLVYGAAELLLGSGPFAVLAFAVTLGNSRHAAKFTGTALGTAGPPTFHRQAALGIRAFVFVGLGATLSVQAALEPRGLLYAAAVCFVVIAARAVAIAVAARRILPSKWDRTAVALMFPLGLPTAAASLIPSARFGLAGTDAFPQIAAVVILVTILVNSALVAFVLQPAVRRRIEPPAGA